MTFGAHVCCPEISVSGTEIVIDCDVNGGWPAALI